MNFSGRGEVENQFQLAPMIDIVFLLLVFFIAVYAVEQRERLLNINLPEASAAQEEGRSMRDIVVDIDAGGRIFLYHAERTPEYLENRLRLLGEFAGSRGEKPGVIIRADGACDHKHVVRVMDICARADVARVFFSTVAMPQDGARNGD